MRSTGFVLITSLAACMAGWLISTGWRQPRPSLESSVRHLRRPAVSAARAAVDARGAHALIARVGGVAMSTRIGERTHRWRRPLRLIGRTVPTHVGLLVFAALAGFVAPALAVALLQVVGVISVGVLIPAGIALFGLVATPVAVHSQAIARSDDVRVDLRHQLSAYLDMVTMLLAGNTGHEGALEQAARAGDGMLFRELRRRMREVGTTGHSLVGALSLVGDDFGVIELEQVAAATSLSAAEGAPVARTLAAKCSTLRSTLAAEQEATARVRNDKVTPPLVGMALLFMALIIYPALNLN
jgi:Flp pilus assembly protein TadB